MSELTPDGDPGHRRRRSPNPTHPGSSNVEDAGQGPDQLSIGDLLGAARRKMWLIGILGLIGLGGAWYITSLESPVFNAISLIRLLNTRGALTSGVAGNDGPTAIGSGADPVLSEIMVLKGRRVVGHVVDSLKLRLIDVETEATPRWLTVEQINAEPETVASLEIRRSGDIVEIGRSISESDAEETFLPIVKGALGSSIEAEGIRFRVETPSPPSGTVTLLSRDQAIDRVLASLQAVPREGTDGVDVTYSSPNPTVAVATVNAVVETYRRMDAEGGQERARIRREFLGGQLEEQEGLLVGAQSELARFRTDRQRYSSTVELEEQQTALNGLRADERALDTERRTLENLLGSLFGGPDDGYGWVSSSTVSTDNSAIGELMDRLLENVQARDSLTTGRLARLPAHPEVQAVDTLIANTQKRLAEALRNHINVLEARIGELVSQRQELAGTIGDLPVAEAEEGRLAQRVATMQTLVDEIRSEHERARVDEAVTTGQVEVVDRATRARRRPSQRGAKLLVGLMMGLMLGSGIAVAWEGLDQTLTREKDLESALNLAILAVVPRIRAEALPGGGSKRRRTLKEGIGKGLVQYESSLDRDPESAEAYRTLRTNLIFSPLARGVHSMVVTSAAPSEGKTLTVANLGIVFAQQGLSVLVVDSDLRRPDLGKLFGIPRSPGLTEVLLGKTTPEKAIRRTDVAGLKILPAGDAPNRASELLGGQRMEKLVGDLHDQFDLVILDSPPVLAASDAAVLGALADGVLLVVRAGRTDRSQVQQVVQKLGLVEATLLGAILNDPDAKMSSQGRYYRYDYAPQDQADDAK